MPAVSKLTGFLARRVNYKSEFLSFIEKVRNNQDPTFQQKNILYQLLKADKFDEATEVMAVGFSRTDTGEPMSQRLKASIDDWKNCCNKYKELFLKDQLSFIATDLNLKGKVVGASMSYDLFSESQGNISPFSSQDKLYPLINAITQLEMKYYNEQHKEKPGVAYHHFLTVTDLWYKGLDIPYILTILPQLKAKSEGYHGVYGEPTGPANQNVHKILGYTVLGDIKYNEYRHPITQEKTFYNLYEDFIKNSTRDNTMSDINNDNFACQLCYKDLDAQSYAQLIGEVDPL